MIQLRDATKILPSIYNAIVSDDVEMKTPARAFSRVALSVTLICQREKDFFLVTLLSIATSRE